ncbi:hypothetical protein FPSE_01821 [Fusarium pseudograminearum CS3096]|uniref:Uncharacterized protein n=1 Tax=Fusarium pseudograminearum (strain CS3096) TaxID=1028729 RepID=K3VUS6_FUSPC|nr:hypothetical protein FPSE_01821 [Fusarium pseudograminearum CS3096]EKJ78033.1 hypothetical protein FPSE_01821 [Fusarium pseudograminearum CS3096]
MMVRVEEDERRSKSPGSPGLRKVGWQDGEMGMGDDAVLDWTGPMRVGIAGARVCSECGGGRGGLQVLPSPASTCSVAVPDSCQVPQAPVQSNPIQPVFSFFHDEESFEWTRNGWMGPWNPRPYPTLPYSMDLAYSSPRAMHLTSPRTERQVTAAGVEQQELKLGCVESSTNRLSLTEAQFTIIKTFKDEGPSPSVSAIFCLLEVGLENKYCPEHLLQVCIPLED